MAGAGRLLAIALMIFLCGCVFSPDESDFVAGRGTIVFNDFEGGFFGIEADDGAHYDPLNLPGEFESAGLRIRFAGRIVENVASVHMWGKIVELSKVEGLEKE